ncbi:MAG TPA: VCBS repeat-containing protein [Gaiellales bacterium]|nr:VCBS repeat-containing protein [Gaiellales bacterium]
MVSTGRLQGCRAAGAAAALGCLLAVSAAGAAGTPPADPSFVPGTYFDAGPAPADAAVADLDGDDAPDLAVASCGESDGENALRILLNDGRGGFRAGPATPLPAGAQPCSLAAADVNGDRKADLAVASLGDKALEILLGDGTGRFATARGSPVHLSGTPRDLAAGDLTGEGHPDLVVPVADAVGRVTGLEVLLGNGAGGFVPAPGSPVPILAGRDLSVAIADLSGDGKADLAVANTPLNEVQILRGDGTGRLGSVENVLAVRSPGPIRVGDVDGNGKRDLAVLETNGVTVLLGDGAGGFRTAPGSPVPVFGNGLAAADLNGDGRTDLAVADAESGGVSVGVAGEGGALHVAALSPFRARSPFVVAAADFDRNGRTEIAALAPGTGFWPLEPQGSTVLLQTASAPELDPAAAGHGPAAVLRTHRQISALAADGKQAVACAGDVPIAWHPPARKAVAFKTAGSGCYWDLAVGGGRIAWTESFCGNSSCNTVVYASKLSGGRRRVVDSEENDCGAGPCELTGVWVEQLLGGGPLIAWNDWSVACSSGCQSDNPSYRLTGQALLRVSGGRVKRVRRDPLPRPLRAVGGGRMALQAGGSVLVLGANGAKLATVPAPDVRSVALSATELGVAGRTTLRLYQAASQAASGRPGRSIPLGPSAALELAGMNASLALLRGPHALVLVRLRDGKPISFPLRPSAAGSLVAARLTAAGLFYAYNVGGTGMPGRIAFEPTAGLLARFRR